MTAGKKPRLDQRVVALGLAASRQRAQALIMGGKILVDQQRVDKPGARVNRDATIVLVGDDQPFVSRGGIKLAGALDATGMSVNGFNCMDVGASTGGFTDCLLQRGANHVYAVDVGYGQLAWKLRQDPRVTVIERTNIRHLTRAQVPAHLDLITIDTSFISLKIVVPAALPFLAPKGTILALIKPQFEVGRGQVGKGGVVRDPRQHQTVIADLQRFFADMALTCGPVIPSPIKGPKGNQEFVMMLRRTPVD
ncbi:MAG: TlyA family RNA methyltransferase [Desulfosarcinaceae bacterium]|nr:TlyA family RNA methyltransferase [Desulfosarcinaceae bacterium]